MNTVSNSGRAVGALDLGQVRVRCGGLEARWSINDLDQDSIELVALGAFQQLPPNSQIELIWPATAADPAFAVSLRVSEANGRRMRSSLHSLDDRQREAIRSRVQGRLGGVPNDAPERAIELIERRVRGPVAGRLRLLIDEAESELRPGTQTELFWNGSPPGQVRQRLAAIGGELVEAFVQLVLRPLRGEPLQPNGTTSRRATLRLVDDDEMAVWLTRSEALRVIERQTRAAWFKLKPALQILFDQKAEIDVETIAGEALIDAWLQAQKLVDCEAALQQLLTGLFGRHEVFDVSAFYLELRQDLQRNGLLFEAVRTRPAARGVAQQDPPSPPAGVVDSESGNERNGNRDTGAQPGESVVAAASGNWSLPPTNAGTAAGWGPVPPTDAVSVAGRMWSLHALPEDLPIEPAGEQRSPIADHTLLQAIRDVVQRQQEQSQSYADFIQAVAEQARAEGEQAIVTSDRQTEALALLARLQTALADDQIVPERFESWSRPLIAPLFGAQMRPEGIGDSGDAVRELFEKIEFGSVLVTERKDAASKQIAEGIDRVVERLAKAPALSGALVTEASNELDRLLQRHRRAASAIEDRVVEACAGQQRLIDARRVVDASLNSGFLGIEVPSAWIQLLEMRLAPLMVLTVLRQGPDSVAWNGSERQLDLLAQDFVSLREGRPPSRSDEEAVEWIRGLLNESEAMSAANRSPLHQLAAALRGEDVEWETYHSVLAHVLNEPKSRSSDHRLDTLAQQVDVLQPGDWMTFKSPDGRPRALKLAWHAPDHERFVFVSQLGHKADDMEREQLIESMRLGDVKVLEDGQSSIIERAWRRMMESMHDQLASQATHDALTGLLNRKELERHLGLWLRRKQREPLLLLWIGVDHMRLLNEARGLEAGDHVLREVGQILREQVEASQAELNADQIPGQSESWAARIAGDEFLLALRCPEGAQAEQRAQQVLDALGQREWRFADQRFEVSASIGVCVADQNCSSIESALRDAEHACRAAKESGGERVYMHRVDDYRLSQMRETFQWVGKVEQSLESQTLVLFGQRALALSQRAEQAGDYLEVLLRMRQEGGYASPEHFIVAAERYGHIAAIDKFVLNDLVRLLKLAKRQEKLRIAFNVSGRNITDAEFVDEIIQVLNTQPWPMSQVCVELTETAAIQQLADASLAMRRLSAAGLSMVLDDFGSGWSSYQYLRRLPFDVVKVDGAFIRDISRNESDLALARSINEVAHVLGKMTVAEHVENEETLKLVKQIGFDYAQGYLVGRPAPLTELLELLSE